MDKKHSLGLSKVTLLAPNQFVFVSVSASEKADREKSQAPVYMVKLRDSQAILGSTASFMIHVRGNPNPEVTL